MKTHMIRGTAAALGLATVLVGSASQVSAAESKPTTAEQSDDAATPAAYANYLARSHESGAGDALRGFQQLTRDEQDKFIDYLHDPTALKSFLDTATVRGEGISARSRNTSNTTSLREGDVVIEKKQTVSGLSSASRPLPKGNHEATFTTSMKLLGVKIITLKLTVNFHSNGRDITKANYAEASKKNLSGVMNISHGLPHKSLSDWGWCQRGRPCSHGHNVDASVIWEGNVVVKGSTFQIDKKQWMRADVYGDVIDYYLHNA